MPVGLGPLTGEHDGDAHELGFRSDVRLLGPTSGAGQGYIDSDCAQDNGM